MPPVLDDARPTVLFVEDTPFWHAIVRDELASDPAVPVRLVCATDATEAMVALRYDKPIIAAILDICLPGPMSGLDILDHLRSASQPWMNVLPVAMLTTSPSGLYMARAKALGVDRYIQKPIHSHMLVTMAKDVREFVTIALAHAEK